MKYPLQNNLTNDTSLLFELIQYNWLTLRMAIAHRQFNITAMPPSDTDYPETFHVMIISDHLS